MMGVRVLYVAREIASKFPDITIDVTDNVVTMQDSNGDTYIVTVTENRMNQDTESWTKSGSTFLSMPSPSSPAVTECPNPWHLDHADAEGERRPHPYRANIRCPECPPA